MSIAIFNIPFLPVAIFYLLSWDTPFYYAVLMSISGPMLGYEWMIVSQLADYHDGTILPAKFREPQLYWLYFGTWVSFTVMEIIGQLIYIPAVRLWYLTKYET